MANIINQLEISGITYDIQDADAQNTLLTKQDALVSGVNIKTINNESLLGSGNIVIEGGTGDAYTKAETDALLAAKADTSTVTSAVTEFSAALGNEIQRAQGVEQVLSGAIDTKVDSNDVYLKSSTSSSTEINNALQAKADASTTYSKTETDNAINAATSGKADTSAVTNAISAATSGKADSSDVYLKSETSSSTEINNALQAKADASTTYSKSEVDTAINAATSGKADTSAVTAAIDAATSGKADTSAVTADINAAVSGKQDTLVSGTNIKTINNQSLLGSGNITIQGGGGANVVELTQAQYDALVTKDPDTFYIITDATPIDTSTFYTTAQTSSSTQIATALQAKADAATTSSATEIATALSDKQNTLTAGSGIDISNDVISVTGGGGGGTIDAALDANSPNAVANSAITAGINARLLNIDYRSASYAGSGVTILQKSYRSGGSTGIGYLSSINNKPIINNDYRTVNKFSLVETSAITTTLTSSSTDSQVPSAKAVYDIVGNINALLSAI